MAETEARRFGGDKILADGEAENGDGVHGDANPNRDSYTIFYLEAKNEIDVENLHKRKTHRCKSAC